MALAQKGLKNAYMGIATADYSAMQGPCNTGFHVPLQTEWQAVRDMGITLGVWTSSVGSGVRTYLKMPYAGMYNNAGTYFDDCEYWSSNRKTSGAYILVMHGSASSATTLVSISSALPIRPFKDGIVIPDNSRTALYQGTGGAGIYHNATLGLISISDDGETRYTMADKNLGATTVYNYGDTLSQANCGYAYQRGNNHGFPRKSSISTYNSNTDASAYGPGNYYDSSIYYKQEPRDTSGNKNLRGGETGVVHYSVINKIHKGDIQVRPDLPPIPYLCFTANTANSTIKLNQVGSPYGVALETSADRKNWSTYTFGTTITLSNVGDTVYWRNKSETTTRFTLSSNFSDCYKFVMTGSIAASGDINYLINKNSTTTVSDYCYFNLFNGCTALTTPPSLTATTLGISCYDRMFIGCTNLVALPELPTTGALPDYCYNYMFESCSNIKLSDSKTGAYQTAYRIPTKGSGTEGTYSLRRMFRYTGGSWSGTPSINTTYYTSNTVIPSNLSTN